MFVTTMSATDFSYRSQLLEKEAATIAQKYKISDDNNFCLRVAKACCFIRESKIDLIERFPINKTIFKISKNITFFIQTSLEPLHIDKYLLNCIHIQIVNWVKIPDRY